MNEPKAIVNTLVQFKKHLEQEEKSKLTVEKYLRDIRKFYEFLNGSEINKEQTIAYKKYLTQQYAVTSVNSMLVALNCFLRFLGLGTCCIKTLKVQRQIFAREDHELTKTEYQNLVKAAKDIKNHRLWLILQTICGTGIRISELQYITVEAIKDGRAIVNCKNKTRVIFIPVPLQKLLKEYSKKAGIKTGTVFISKNGKALDRSNIWRDMKALCKHADVCPKKVFPHNLRHLFARTFYSIEKDIVRLADLLGHSSINTTRIYTMETGFQHVARLEQVQLLLKT